MEKKVQSAQQAIRSFVTRRISEIQACYLESTRHQSGARQLAILRRAVTKEPGSDPDIWMIEFEGLPEFLVGKGQQASLAEYAVHVAFTLYAVHQQSLSTGMHQVGREHSLGFAIKQLTVINHSKYQNLVEGQLPRRFAALITANSFYEVSYYARQIIHQLRLVEIPLDYGLLAQQFYDLQDPYRADGVRLAWGRDFAKAHIGINSEAKNMAERQCNA